MPAWGPEVRRAVVALLALASPALAQPADLVSRTAFRVCADPAAWPSSSEAKDGYENAIAELLAAELGRPVAYTWFPMAPGFIRRTLAAGECDVVMGYAQGDELVLNTNHYLTTTHVLVTAVDGPFADVIALDDPRLAEARIGVVAGTPPVDHLARAGRLSNIKSYNLFADLRVASPPQQMLADLEAGTIDVALMWGPIAGPMVQRDHPGLVAIPLIAPDAMPPLHYRITMGVRQGEDAWKRELNSLLRRHQDEIDAILREAGVPVLDDMGEGLKP